jgi:predicted glycogen debranching enzyme
LVDAAFAIVEGFTRGTRHGIRVDDDGLVAAGEPGVQVTWMDAKVGDRVITPRIGKPVEIQALWLNSLRFIARSDSSYVASLERGLRSFEQRFFDDELGYLVDVVDEDHVRGQLNRQLRPNQLFAIGGLPFQTLQGDRAERAVSVVEQRLWTPMGPRSLDPNDPAYVGVYQGGPVERDSAYHQGTVWPWLVGPFIEAWVRTHGNDRTAKETARNKFLEPLLRHQARAGLGHVSEIADGDAPHSPKGAPFQAWSVGEVLRMKRWLDGPSA